METKRILVTGGCGFIGSHLCETLLRQGHEVICLDNCYSGQKSNIGHLLADPRFTWMLCDVTEPIDIPCDQIYNLACPASPPFYQNDPIKTIKTSFLGALNVLELAGKYGARVLQTSTSEVYGDPLVHPQTETYWGHVNPIGIRSCYDEGKRAAETLFFDYHRQRKTDIKVVRIFNTYGPNMRADDGRVVSNFILQALKGEDLTIYGDGSQTRSFCYVDDLVRGLITMMDSDEGVIGPVNLGNPSERTMLDLAERIIALTDSRSKIVYRPLPSDDPTQRKPDITRAKELLGWEPRVDIDTGLRKTIEYFKKTI